MDPITQQVVLATAGAAAADEATYVDDVFSTFLYEGTGSTQSINNGIDLSSEGGFVWIKRRTAGNHQLYDTERGATKSVNSNDSSPETTRSGGLTSFNSNGFTIGDFTDENASGQDACSWTFRKAPGFFDVVTYTGNGTNQSIAHNLGSVPGCMMIKNLDSSTHWVVYHRGISVPAEKALVLNENWGEDDDVYFNDTAPTSTHFTVGPKTQTNTNNETYVAYLFAHDDQSFGTDEDEAIIKCGSYTTNSSGVIPDVDLGFEPQWLLIKKAVGQYGNTGNWYLYDSMRGMPVGYNEETLYPNLSNAAITGANTVELTPTGFTSGPDYLASGTDTFIYIAIRRPHKPPTAGTDVFALDTFGGILPNPPGFNAGFTVDAAFSTETASSNTQLCSRLTDKRRMFVNLTNAEDDNTTNAFDYQDGWNSSTAVTTGYVSWMFRRAPGFFDVVAYTGTGSLSGVNHNLGVTPELKIIKKRSGTGQWVTGGTAVAGENGYFYLDSNDALHSNSGYWSGGDDSATKFSVKNGHSYSDSSGSTYVAYLFATLDGISKIGSYTGTGNDVNVDCGFTGGARFVLIKRTDSTGDWYVWDTLRGIVSGNDPYKLLNSTAAQVTNTDYIDPLNAGFTVTSSAPAALNTSGGTYLFLAIA